MATTEDSLTIQSNLLNEIERIQEIEQGIYNKVQTEDLTDTELTAVMEPLAQLAVIKKTLYFQLNTEYKRYTQVGDLTTDLMREQRTALAIVEKQLADTKKQIQQAQEQVLQDQRMTEMHQTLTKKYHSYSNISMIIIAMCLAIISATIVGSILGTWATFFIIVAIVCIGIYYLFKEMLAGKIADKKGTLSSKRNKIHA